jgi:hypothetical protein
MPDIPPDPGETDDPDVSPGPHDDLGAPGPSQFTTTLVPAVVVPPPPPGEDPPDAPAEPDPFTDASGSILPDRVKHQGLVMALIILLRSSTLMAINHQ